MADYIYLVQMDIPEELEADFNRIYDTQHIPNIVKAPGVHSCTRYPPGIVRRGRYRPVRRRLRN